MKCCLTESDRCARSGAVTHDLEPISNALCDFEKKIKPWSILTLNVTDLWIDNMIQNF